MSVQLTVSNNDTNRNRDRKINCPVCNTIGKATVKYTEGYIVVTHTHKPPCYMRNDAEKRMVMQVLVHWLNFESKALPKLLKYGTLEKVREYIPDTAPKVTEVKKEKEYVSEGQKAKKLQYRQGELVELVQNGKRILTTAHINYSQRSNKAQKKCPRCGQLGRQFKNFSQVDKKGYYDVYYQHKKAYVKFIDVNTGKTVKTKQIKDVCRVGKGYTVEMMFNAMNNEKKSEIN